MNPQPQISLNVTFPPPLQQQISLNVTAPAVDSGDTAWMLASTALVMLMTPGLAFFYGGLVRSKNMINTMMMSYLTLGLVTVHWVVIGYTFAFGPGNYFYGSGEWVGLRLVGQTPNSDYAATIPHLLYCVYQLMFAIITPAIISGAIVERMKFVSYVIFIFLWITIVYDMIAHWVWSAWSTVDEYGNVTMNYGWLRALGAIDFAGGTVVHISSGVSALIAALVVGKRYDLHPMQIPRPANVPYVLLGGALLWFGWFGFNGGSALQGNGLASLAFINSQIAAGTGFMAWLIIDMIVKKEASAVGAVSGAVIGLVGITPAAGYVHPPSSIAFGIIPVLVIYVFVHYKAKYLPGIFPGLDDSLDVFACHGLGGMVGCILLGFFASTEVNSSGANGVFFGRPILLGYQLAAIAATILLATVFTFIILIALKFSPLGLAYNPENTLHGIDLKAHGNRAHDFGDDVKVDVEMNSTSTNTTSSKHV